MEKLVNLEKDLTCPISGDLLENPIVVPCCTNAFSRAELVKYLDGCSDDEKYCPNCRSDISNFDAANAPVNRQIAKAVESFRELSQDPCKLQVKIRDNKEPVWTTTVTPIINNRGESLPVAELKITLENAKFVPRPSLFIAVVDRSGSMSGAPWRQVESALLHIFGLVQSCPFVKLVIVAYDSNAEIINLGNTQIEGTNAIRKMFNGGGTNFRAAFNKVKDVLVSYICSTDPKLQNKPNNVESATVAFLTDGESGDNREDLIKTFREILIDCWTGPVTVHAIGFGGNCDRDFLEGLWKTGTIPGTFRYAEPQDSGDTLCCKLTTLFEKVASSSHVEFNLEMNKLTFYREKSAKAKIQFPINERARGEFKIWVRLPEKCHDYGNLTITTNNEKIETEIIVRENRENIRISLFHRWISYLIDELATEVLDLSTRDRAVYGADVFQLHCAIVQQKIDAISICLEEYPDKSSQQRLEIIAGEISQMRQGLAVNKGKLGDLRFGDQYIAVAPKPNIAIPDKHNNNAITNEANAAITEYPIKYTRNNRDKNRNALQCAIMNNIYNSMNENTQSELNKSTIDDILYCDIDGNNTVMLAAYCGQISTLEAILAKYPDIKLETKNAAGETAMTMAIKSRGYWKTVTVLLKSGAVIPGSRRKGLEQYAIANGFINTANIIASTSDVVTTDINANMKPDTIRFIYDRAVQLNKPFDIMTYITVCLEKCMIDMVEKLIKNHAAVITAEMLYMLCVPNSELHFRQFQSVLDICKNLDLNYRNIDGDTLLFRCSERGCLEHVKVLLTRGVAIDTANLLGNTPLWIACCNRFTDIASVLISSGANVNHVNEKGNSCLTPVCQRGPVELAELLLANGIVVERLNRNGDSPILLCCRNGQADVLKLLLDRVDPEFAKHRAHIDGFSPILAATESDRSECIRVLCEYGCDIEEKTESDNNILAGATSLHLAAYYGRGNAARTLLSLGANPNSRDVNQCTPLHIAVMQNQFTIARLLINSKADVMARDSVGYTPASYCRDSSDMTAALTNPALEKMMMLARGEFAGDQEKTACQLLKNSCGVVGCLTIVQSVDIFDATGKTPLMESIINSNFEVAKTLLEIGANPGNKNLQGVDCFVWAEWVGNARIKKLLPPPPLEAADKLQRLKAAAAVSMQNSMILYLGAKPSKIKSLIAESKINLRMNDFVNILVNEEIKTKIQSEMNKKYQMKNSNLVDFFNRNTLQLAQEENILKSIVWMGKTHAANLIAAGATNLNAYQIMAIYMFTNNIGVAHALNDSLIKADLSLCQSYMECLNEALALLPAYTSEVYRGISNLQNRRMFLPGSEIIWPVYVSGASLWRVALENTPDFTTKKRQGTIMIMKSINGKYIGSYSQSPQDTEVIFMPGTKFRVTAWYVGDTMALGQQNIRASTFKIREENMETMITTNNSLIIEMQEC